MAGTQSALTYLTRTRVPGGAWIGVGSGVLVALAVQEVLFAAGAGLTAIVAVSAMAVVADRFTRGLVRAPLGIAAASAVVFAALEDDNCFELPLPGDQALASSVLIAALFGWVIAMVIGSRVASAFLNSGMNVFIVMFAVVELAMFLLSPAGVPVASIYPFASGGLAISAVLVAAVAAGFRPGPTSELLGWALGLAQILIFAHLLSTPSTACNFDAMTGAAASVAGATTAYVLSRLVPIR